MPDRLTGTVIAIIAGGLLCGACTTTGAMERNAAGGGLIGALTGAVIGNNIGDRDPGKGAAIGAAVGATAGAVKGCRDDGGCRAAPGPRQYFDEPANRYYYFDKATGRYYWENGDPRN